MDVGIVIPLDVHVQHAIVGELHLTLDTVHGTSRMYSWTFGGLIVVIGLLLLLLWWLLRSSLLVVAHRVVHWRWVLVHLVVLVGRRKVRLQVPSLGVGFVTQIALELPLVRIVHFLHMYLQVARLPIAQSTSLQLVFHLIQMPLAVVRHQVVVIPADMTSARTLLTGKSIWPGIDSRIRPVQLGGVNAEVVLRVERPFAALTLEGPAAGMVLQVSEEAFDQQSTQGTLGRLNLVLPSAWHLEARVLRLKVAENVGLLAELPEADGALVRIVGRDAIEIARWEEGQVQDPWGLLLVLALVQLALQHG